MLTDLSFYIYVIGVFTLPSYHYSPSQPITGINTVLLHTSL